VSGIETPGVFSFKFLYASDFTCVPSKFYYVLRSNFIYQATCTSGRNKGQKLVSRFLKIGHFVDYWLPSNWKCTVRLADQNGFWLAKCWNWSENGQWPTVISNTAVHCSTSMLLMTVNIVSSIQDKSYWQQSQELTYLMECILVRLDIETTVTLTMHIDIHIK